MPDAGNKMRAVRLFQGSIRVEGFALTAGKRARLRTSLVKALGLLSCLGRQNKDGAKMVAGRVDTKPAEAIP